MMETHETNSQEWIDNYQPEIDIAGINLQEKETNSGTLFDTPTVQVSHNGIFPLFSFYRKPILNVHPARDLDLQELYELIKGDLYEPVTQELRLTTENEVDKFKRTRLDSVTVSGTFYTREDNAIINHSGLVCIDFDDVEDINKLKKWLAKNLYTLMVFVSPSGTGLKWILRVNPKLDHKKQYNAIINYLTQQGIEYVDTSCINVSRACFLGHDRDVFINPDVLAQKSIGLVPMFPFEEYFMEPSLSLSSASNQNLPTTGEYHLTIEQEIESVKQIISKSLLGEKHDDLVKASFLLGGCVAGGSLSEDLARYILREEISKKENVNDLQHAYNTIDDCLSKGMGKPIITKQPTASVKQNIKQMLENARVNVNEKVEAPNNCIEIIHDGFASAIGTLGNFSLVIGKAKSRKTFFIAITLASVVKSGTVLDKIRGCLPTAQKNILYFDTEQGKYHLQNSVNRILRLNGNQDFGTLHPFGLRKYSAQERLEMIEYAIYNTPELGFVVIDGLRDLITSINDEAQASMLSSKLLKWSEEKNIHIIGVLHQNKGDNNARGHIGTELINKAETVLSVTKEKNNSDISIVEAEYCRGKDFPPFAFEVDDAGLPQLSEIAKKSTETSTRLKSPFDYDPKFHQSILRSSFSKDKEYSYREMWQQIKLASAGELIKISDNKAKEFLTYYQKENFIIKTGKMYLLPV